MLLTCESQEAKYSLKTVVEQQILGLKTEQNQTRIKGEKKEVNEDIYS